MQPGCQLFIRRQADETHHQFFAAMVAGAAFSWSGHSAA
ncbi:hypothetical protein ART_0822 [Arthrobacter sp. PAMC 25486]|nr:hypothetical protein ART_0822 [Arthrobacter sp. PAMC 25486]